VCVLDREVQYVVLMNIASMSVKRQVNSEYFVISFFYYMLYSTSTAKGDEHRSKSDLSCRLFFADVYWQKNLSTYHVILVRLILNYLVTVLLETVGHFGARFTQVVACVISL